MNRFDHKLQLRSKLTELVSAQNLDTAGSALVSLATHGDDSTRSVSIQMLGTYRFPECVPFVSSVCQTFDSGLDDPQEFLSVLDDCCSALAWMDSAESHRMLIAFARSALREELRAAAVAKIGHFDNWFDFEELVEFLRDEERPAIKIAALYSISQQIDFDNFHIFRDVILDAAADLSPDVRAAAIDLLPYSQEAGIVRTITEYLDDRARLQTQQGTVSDFASGALKVYKDLRGIPD
jgi:HEAT repeat protein